MNFCKSDIYFIIVLILFAYLYWNQNKPREGFQSTADVKKTINEVYQADIEAVRNLSNIANQLITNNSLTMPGTLNITSNLTVSGNLAVNSNSNIKGHVGIDGNVSVGNDLGLRGKWLFHTPGAGDNMFIGAWDGTKKGWDYKYYFEKSGRINTKEIKIGSWVLREVNGHLQFVKDGTTYNDDYTKIPKDNGFAAIAHDGNIWTNRSINQGWISDMLAGKVSKSGDTINGNLNVTGMVQVSGYSIFGGGDGLRISTGGPNDDQRHFFPANPGQRNYYKGT